MASANFMSKMKLCVLVTFMVVSLGAVSDSLLCYQCAASASSQPCVVDTGGMVNASLGLNDLYVKNCTDSKPDWKYCKIERFESNAQVTAYVRDCHDGTTFGFADSALFQGVNPNNQTTCGMVNSIGKLVCFSLCDTDYCNGPEKPVIIEEIDPCDLVNSTHNASFFGCGAMGIRATDGPLMFLGLWLFSLILTCWTLNP